MSHKKKVYELAEQHGITIDNFAGSVQGEVWGTFMATLPEGYQIAEDDERRGISQEGGGLPINEFWKYVREDLEELIANKDYWAAI